ncbi:MAG: hypothetical protein KDC98_23400 [Planctomycetes bacterium]|nr:hypothetical protein [Planctomycetota bacterium]
MSTTRGGGARATLTWLAAEDADEEVDVLDTPPTSIVLPTRESPRQIVRFCMPPESTHPVPERAMVPTRRGSVTSMPSPEPNELPCRRRPSGARRAPEVVRREAAERDLVVGQRSDAARGAIAREPLQEVVGDGGVSELCGIAQAGLDGLQEG